MKKTNIAAVAGLAAGLCIIGTLAGAFLTAAGVALGGGLAGAPAATMIGATAIGAVGAIGLGGVAAGMVYAIRKMERGAASGVAAAVLGAVALGGILTGTQMGAAQQQAQSQQNEIVSIRTGNALRATLDAHPDRQRVEREIRDSVTEKLRRESRRTFELCVSNPDSFRARGVECAVFDTPPPLSSPAP